MGDNESVLPIIHKLGVVFTEGPIQLCVNSTYRSGFGAKRSTRSAARPA